MKSLVKLGTLFCIVTISASQALAETWVTTNQEYYGPPHQGVVRPYGNYGYRVQIDASSIVKRGSIAYYNVRLQFYGKDYSIIAAGGGESMGRAFDCDTRKIFRSGEGKWVDANPRDILLPPAEWACR